MVRLTLIAGACVSVVFSGEAHAYSSKLLRYPYLTDVVGNSATINWATDRSSTTGTMKWGAVANGSCNASSKTAAKTSITVGPLSEYQWKARLTLSPDTEYCYRVYLGKSPQVDLLGTDRSPRFLSQLPAGSSKPFTFAVFGNWGQVDSDGANPQQANLMRQIATSGARFALTIGDNAYNSGTQTNYGDLVQVGAETSAVFGPPFWKVPGASLPLFPALGNHGISTASTHFLNWPQAQAVSSSGGRYTNDTYCCLNGTESRKLGSAWYAFDAGNARFYVLQASWSDTNVGTATDYRNDYDYHWTLSSPEYRWLQNDLATHPSQLKFAVFQYPIYSDSKAKPSDTFLQGADGLEGLLSRYGVDIAFGGHAHIYQRNVKPHAGSLVTYTTGGGGARLAPIGESGCSSVDAYGIGWSNSANEGRGRGSACGAAPVPTAKDQVFHFLRVSVNGNLVTVTPTDSLGRSFDEVTYAFGQASDRDTLRPRISQLRATRRAFAVAAGSSGARRGRPRRGTTFIFRLSESAAVSFAVERRSVGRTVGRSCRKRTVRNRKRQRCVRWRRVGRFAHQGTTGANRKKFSGWIRRRALRSGSYRARLVATDAAGNRSREARIRFRIVRARGTTRAR